MYWMLIRRQIHWYRPLVERHEPCTHIHTVSHVLGRVPNTPDSCSVLLFSISLNVCVCVSGERLCSVEDCTPGAGTYLRHGSIFASLAGYVLRRNEGEEVRTWARETWHTVFTCVCVCVCGASLSRAGLSRHAQFIAPCFCSSESPQLLFSPGFQCFRLYRNFSLI